MHALRAAAVLPGLRPARTARRPDSCRRTPRSTPPTTAATRLDALLKDDPTSTAGAPMSGAARSASILPLNVQLPNDFFAQAVVVAKDVAARERLQQKLEKALAEEFPDVVGARLRRWNSGRRSAGRCSTGSAGPTRTRCARSRCELAADGRRRTANAGTSTSTGWSRRAGARPGRPGQARLLGLSSQALAGTLNAVVTGVDGHPGARRHLSRRRRRARHRRAARVARRRCARCRCRCRAGASCRCPVRDASSTARNSR